MNYLDLYTSLVKVNSLLPVSSHEIEDKIEGFKAALTTEPDNPEYYTGEYFEALATSIYNLTDKIQDYVDDLAKLSSNSKLVRGITKATSINVMLLGETSAGKTSFLERIFGENCGDTGPNPITAFAVTHKTTTIKSYLEVKFNPEFVIDGSDRAEEFKSFLRKYGFYNQFVINKATFNTNGEEFQLDNKDKFLNFINESNSYPQAFDEIVWHHKESQKQVKFTRYANFIDMPGSGGQDEHTENIETAIAKYGKDVDIVLYLIKSDQGVPSNYNFLKVLKKQLEQNGTDPFIYFVYQIDNRDEFSAKVNALREFVAKDTTTDAINPFNNDERKFYRKAIILDARGKRKEQKKTNIALASVLRHFTIVRAEKFYKSLNVANTPDEFNILEVGKYKKQIINAHLFDFMEETAAKCKGGNLPKIKEVKKHFKQKFCIDNDHFNLPIFNDDLKITLNNLKNNIDENVKELFDYVSTGWLDGKKFDPTKYGQDFYDKYKKEPGWNALIYNIQAFHWLRLTYNENSLNMPRPLKSVYIEPRIIHNV